MVATSTFTTDSSHNNIVAFKGFPVKGQDIIKTSKREQRELPAVSIFKDKMINFR